jgi:HD-like signal output (HDOD) protein
VPTRRRLLFVDDDVRVRESLQRLVRPLEEEWRTTFVGNGRAALELLDRDPFDVLVTDLAMPDMSGSELVAAVRRSHPKVVRIALAPLSEQPRAMACGPLLHQFLALPVELEVLRSAVNRACDVEISLRREQIGRLVARMDRLPSLPDLYHKMVEKMNDPECSIDEVAALVARDISMTARILKLVNSAFFGLRYRVSSPTEAVNYLGLDTIKALVLSINAFAQFENLALGGVHLESLWNHSLAVAGLAKLIAHAEDGHARLLDEVFVSGMLHDTGKLVLGANFGREYEAALAASRENPGGMLAAEEAAFGATHADVGGYLLGLWGLPGPIVDAVSWHHTPGRCPEPAFGSLACVHVANTWAHGDQAEENGSAHAIDHEFIERLGLTDRLEEWRRSCLEADAGGVGT